MALLLDRQTIEGLLDMDKMIEILEQAFGELSTGSAIMPQRTAVADADVNGWYAFMPAQLKDMGALGVKSVTVYKDNPSAHSLPRNARDDSPDGQPDGTHNRCHGRRIHHRHEDGCGHRPRNQIPCP